MSTRLSVDELESRETPNQIPLLDPFGFPVPSSPTPILVPLAAVVGWAGALAPTTPSE
jgi:hypothetical protein